MAARTLLLCLALALVPAAAGAESLTRGPADWQQRGGSLLGYEARGQGVFILLPEALKYGGKTYPAMGGGGGAALRATYYFMSPPVYGGKPFWWALKLGSGVDIAGAGASFPIPPPPAAGDSGAGPPGKPPASGESSQTGEVGRQTVSATQLSVPVMVGAQFGVGSFVREDIWDGWVLGVSLTPSYSYSKFGPLHTVGKFNPTGFEVTLDSVTLSGAVSRLTPPPHFRIAGFVLPPYQKLPLIAALGIGAAWY